jgi:class 3 adenylate cyclase/tetratricopeptide (TPR) repeat protein
MLGAMTGETTALPEEHRAQRTLVVVDLVESVRLMQAHEADVIDRWRRFVSEIRTQVLPTHGGRLVKSLGDGLLLEFENVPPAIAAALEVQARIAPYNAGRDTDSAMYLRIGAHVADIVVDGLDIYGAGVNLTARLAGLGRPGDIVVSTEVRDHVLTPMDAELEDMGECEVKGLLEPVRAYQVCPSHSRPAWRLPADPLETRATLAVMPFDTVAQNGEGITIEQIVADDLTLALSASRFLRVTSRLSTNALRMRKPTLAELREHLHADYVLSGSCLLHGNRLAVRMELASTDDGSIVWADASTMSIGDLFDSPNPATEMAVAAVTSAIVECESRGERTRALPTLRSHSLLFGAISLMHRLSRRDFDRSRELLDAVRERHPRSPEPYAWLGKWHVMRFAQGWSTDPLEEARRAQRMTQKALELQADHSLALAFDGLSEGFLKGDLAASARRYEAALAANPNESFAWLFSSALHAYQERGRDAAQAARSALHLSPLDPMRYFFDSFVANAMLAAGRYQESIHIGQRSIRANCTHMPTYRSLAIAQMLGGLEEDARQTIARLQRIAPGYTCALFRERYPGRGAPHAAVYETALRAAGLPAA